MRSLKICVAALLVGSFSDEAIGQGPNPSNYKVAGAWYANAEGTVSCGNATFNGVGKVLLYTSPNSSEFPIFDVYNMDKTSKGSFFITPGNGPCIFSNMYFVAGGS